MQRRWLLAAAGALIWPLAAAAADLPERRFEDAGWRRIARLAATPICDVFRAGGVSDEKYRTYKDREQQILLARKAMNERDGVASRYLAVLMPGDFVRGCR